ncbi:hypothetical protein FQA39_LY06319 [Lamprigera yunnana]|nr:hypothetical protein FQA39_LY06319 [Lamprigera yunnana]
MQVRAKILLDNRKTILNVPLRMRESWIQLAVPVFNLCICDSGVNPTVAYKSIMFTEVPNDPCLKCFYRCLAVKLKIMDAITGEFMEEQILRQVQGITPALFKKCNDKVKDEVDLCKKAFEGYMCIIHAAEQPVPQPEAYHPVTTETPIDRC